jgi:hypothetical protein
MQTSTRLLFHPIGSASLVAVLGVLLLSAHGKPPERLEPGDPKAPTTLTTPADAFPILAWNGVPEAETTVARYRELAGAGFTHSLISVSNADQAFKQLEVGKATDVKLIVSCGDLLGEKAATTVKRFKDHPALGAYYVRDEPSAGDFVTVAAQVKRIQTVDSRHPCYVNLFPNYATTGTAGQLGTATYQEYVDRFVREVPVTIISFDHYPVVAGFSADGQPTLRPEWYENLEIVAAAARKARKPMWAFALSCPHGPYPPPTAAHLRVQVYSDLAYGAQAIQYFTYWTPEPREFDFHDGPITANGKRTATYALVKQMNREIQALRGVFQGARVLSLGHTGPQRPRGTRPYEPTTPIKAVKTEGQGAVVAILSNAGRQFLVIVNRDITRPMPVTVELDGSAPVHRVAKDGSLGPVAGGRFEARLEPGDVGVLTWPGKPTP